MNRNKVTVQITGFNSAIPAKILLQKFCLLRTAEKVGDVETINHTQLGRLNHHGVKYKKLSTE
jgi:hypothetical protein